MLVATQLDRINPSQIETGSISGLMKVYRVEEMDSNTVRTTHVIEVPLALTDDLPDWDENDPNGYISQTRIESWREQELREDLERAALVRDAT